MRASRWVLTWLAATSLAQAELALPPEPAEPIAPPTGLVIPAPREVVPTGLPEDSVVDRLPGVQRLHVALRDQPRPTLNRHQEGRWQTVWSSELPALAWDKLHRLEMAIGADQLRVRMDGQSYNTGHTGTLFVEFIFSFGTGDPIPAGASASSRYGEVTR